jgi:hypothetical protein
MKTKMLLSVLFTFAFLLSPCLAQTPANFSGVWIQDTVKSDDFYKSFDVVYTIAQTPQSFTVKQVFTFKSTGENITNNYSFTLDGKVTTMKKEQGLEKNTAQWSADKKILTTRSVVTYGTEDVGFTETYSISGKDPVLTVVKSNIIEGAQTVKLIFNKK